MRILIGAVLIMCKLHLVSPFHHDTTSVDDRPLFHDNTARQCNIHNCFDLLRCQYNVEKTIGVHIYPDNLDFASANTDNRHTWSLEYKHFIDAIIASPHYERDPSKACIFVPAIDTFDLERIILNIGPSFGSLSSTLANLSSLWNSTADQRPGFNHLIVSMTPPTTSSITSMSDLIDIGVGYAMLANPFMNSWSLRPGFDFAIPFYSVRPEEIQLQTDSPAWNVITTQFDSIGQDTKKILLDLEQSMNGELLILGSTCPQQKYLASMSGSDYGSYSAKIDPAFNVSISELEHSRCSPINGECRCTRDGLIEFAYPDILSQASFCLILPIAGSSPSYNLAHPLLRDALMNGCIPVIATDECVLPLDWDINWSNFAVRIPSRVLMHLPRYLATFDKSEIQRRRELARQNWHRNMRSMDTIVQSILRKLNRLVYPIQESECKDC